MRVSRRECVNRLGKMKSFAGIPRVQKKRCFLFLSRIGCGFFFFFFFCCGLRALLLGCCAHAGCLGLGEELLDRLSALHARE